MARFFNSSILHLFGVIYENVKIKSWNQVVLTFSKWCYAIISNFYELHCYIYNFIDNNPFLANFEMSQSLLFLMKMSSRTFSSPKLSLGDWIWHCLHENCPKYLPDITTWTCNIAYLIPQLFSRFKNYKLHWFSNSFPLWISAFIDTGLQLMKKIDPNSNAHT